MKLLSIMAMAVFAVSALGQTTTMVSTNLGKDLTLAPFTGRLCVTPMLADRATAFSADGAAQVLPTRTCFPIVAGVLQNAVVPDTSLANPPIGLAAVIQDQNGFTVYPYPQLLFPSGQTFNFDSYAPTQTVKVTTPTINFSTSAPTGDCGSAFAIDVAGTVTNASTYYCISHQWALQTGTGGEGVQADWNATSGLAVILNKPTLATVATSGSYNDLSNKPSIPAAQVNSDWTAVSGLAQILNKPTIPAAVSIDGNTGAFTFGGTGVSHTGNAYTFTNSGGSMVYPPSSGIPVVVSGASWGTTLAVPSGFAFMDATSSVQTQLNGKQASLGFTPVPNTTTVNGHALSSNVTVSASDLTTGTLPHAQLPILLAGDIPALSYDASGAASAAQAAAESYTNTATAALFPLAGGTITGATTISVDGTSTPALSLGSGGASTSSFMQIAGNRSMVGFYSPTGNLTLQGGQGHGIDFNANGLTFGLGRVGGITSAGVFQFGSSNQFQISAAGVATGPTPTSGDNTTKFATTAFVQTAIAGISGGGISVTDLGSLTYTSGGTTTFAAASSAIAAGKVTVTHSTSSTLSPTGLAKWGTYTLEIVQDSTGGGVTLTLGTAGICSGWKMGGNGGGAITLSTGANVIDILTFTYDGVNCVGNFRQGFN